MKLMLTIASLQLLDLCLSSRILAVFALPSPSHHIVYRSYTEALARRGHEIVVLTPSPARYVQPEFQNITEIDDKGKSLASWQGLNRSRIIINYDIVKYYYCHGVKKLVIDLAVAQMDHDDARAFFQRRNQTFDLVIVQNYAPVFLPLAAHFEAPLIIMSTSGGLLDDYEAVGNPYNPIIYPELASSRSKNSNLLHKIDAVAFNLCRMFFDWYWNAEADGIVRQYVAPDLPRVEDMFSEVSLIFLNVFPLLAHIRPSVPAITYLGGVHLKETKNLTGDLKEFLDSSNQDVIYMSLGSNAKSMFLSGGKVKALCNVFSRMPYRVVWKWEKDDFQEKPENVFTAKWLPQQDLLAHPRVKLFISQVGQQSLEEAVYFQVPVIGMPMILDQYRLAQRIVELGIGVSLQMEKLDEQALETAIKKVLEDDSYQTNMRRISRILRDHRETGLERAMWWTEYVIRHKGAHHLRAPVMSLYEYLMVDVFAAIFIAIILIAFLSYFSIKFVTCSFQKRDLILN